MILNVSGRTDVVAFYSEWFMKRYKAGFFDVRNPFNKHLVSRIFVEDIDAIVFCTKNPLPIINKLKDIDKPIIFQVTLTPYKKDIEPGVPDKSDIIKGIKNIAEILGSENVYVRYDPIFVNDDYDIDYHIKVIDKMCSLLEGYTKVIIISFLDDYKNVRHNWDTLKPKVLTVEDYEKIGINFSRIARDHGMVVQTCAEKENLCEYGFTKGDCVSHELAFKLTGKSFPTWKARKNGECNCVAMVDIGDYNSCGHLCKYCYANYDEKRVASNRLLHDDESTILIGKIEEGDIIKRRYK